MASFKLQKRLLQVFIRHRRMGYNLFEVTSYDKKKETNTAGSYADLRIPRIGISGDTCRVPGDSSVYFRIAFPVWLYAHRLGLHVHRAVYCISHRLGQIFA